MNEIILYCSILGNALNKIFAVINGETSCFDKSDVHFDNYTVSVLHNLIKEKGASKITSIWKVENVTEGSERWKILEEKSSRIDIEKDLGGELMDSKLDH